MGQKVNPKGMRLLITHTWPSKWFASKGEYTKLFHRDLALRKTIRDTLVDAGIADIVIERSVNKVIINIYSSKPGVIIGRKGVAIDDLKDGLEKRFKNKFEINIKEIKKPELSAILIADNISRQIEKRVAYRRAAKMAIDRAIEAGAIGVKVHCAGRLNGVEIARGEFFKSGNIPLHTFRSDIDYALDTARTTYGIIGVKVWVYKGEVFKKKQSQTLMG
jgi:small subunit ribosomal protein S3